MHALTARFALAGCLLLAFAAISSAQDKIDAAKLVGKWTFVKTDAEEAPPPGTNLTLTFTKDGKATLNIKIKDKAIQVKGTYSVKGNQLTTILTGPGGKSKTETVTITVLTDKKFVTTEKSKSGKIETTEFKR